MINLIIADSEIELVPERIASHPTVRASSKKRNKKAVECLLDSSLHYAAMRHLEDGNRRGRADIVHFCLLLALDSIPSREGRLRTYVHTRGNFVMEFNPSVRLPRNYNRFQGLMENVLVSGSIESGSENLVALSEEKLKDLLLRLGQRNTLLTEHGRRVEKPFSLANRNIIIGGFPHGDFISDLSGIAIEEISLYNARIMAWTAVSIITSMQFTLS